MSEVSGQYNVKKRRSVLTITTHRSLNGLEYKCEVQDQDTLSDSEVLQVKCEDMMTHLCSIYHSISLDCYLTLLTLVIICYNSHNI